MSSIQLTLTSDKNDFKVSYSPAIDLDKNKNYEIALIDLSFMAQEPMTPGNIPNSQHSLKPFMHQGGMTEGVPPGTIVECSLVRNSYLNDKMEKILNLCKHYPIYVPIDNTDRIKEVYIKISAFPDLKPIEFSGEIIVKIILHIRPDALHIRKI